MTADQHWLARARALAELGRYTCSPNPMVGAVIVRDGRIMGEGFHARAGEPHAEIHALRAAGPRARGACLYVTLEPCCTHGRTPPCTDAIIAAGIARVVVGTIDPNPAHAGRGLALLRQAGIETLCLNDRTCAELNERFNHFITTRRPFVHAKWAMSADGKIAPATGSARWISCPESRTYVHKLRAEYDAVMVGIGTVLADNPQLNVRLEGTWRQPTKIIIDSHLRTPANAALLQGAPTVIACARAADPSHADALRAAGARIIALPGPDDRVDLPALLELLGSEGITSVFVEGGAALFGSLFAAQLVQRATIIIAPMLLGGQSALSPIGGPGVPTVEAAWRLTDVTITSCGVDTILSGRVAYPRSPRPSSSAVNAASTAWPSDNDASDGPSAPGNRHRIPPCSA
ncbi:MAG: bifunctional diaminohydroxyphosphoribosylaminopyrimidine deaminase/5-amino-6-(5-phosphoribosylamino)uracil reductase RibD [bacterium]|nr:bifunctional diaminohydroxyphosphoribosylaminopyrimidine deaminase/5-amino-6-(5-phosphoribosylamino)uracil reductase RibD [bacterium]